MSHSAHSLVLPRPARWPGYWWTAQERRVRRLLGNNGGHPATGPLILTGSRVDTGLWWRQARVWLALGENQMHWLAPGPRPLALTIPFTAIQNCGYNHVTGHLWFDFSHPPSQPLQALKLSPGIARQLLPRLQPPKPSAYA